MKNKQRIHDLETLDAEILRQQLDLKESSQKMESDIRYMRNHFFKIARNSLKKEAAEYDASFFDPLFKNDHVRHAITGITNRIVDHTGEAIGNLIDGLFAKHK